MTITTGPNLGVMEDGAAGDVHVNEFKLFLRAMDLLVQCNVVSATTTAQPGSPSNGDAYILPTGATGAVWAGNAGKIARWTTKTSPAQWDLFTPKEGWSARARDTDLHYTHNGTAWAVVPVSRDIYGAMMVYAGTNAVTITTGEAYIQSTGTRIAQTSDMPITGISIGNSVLGHIYIYPSGNGLAAEISTTAPAAPFFGTARSKTGDTSRRYVGSIRTTTTGAVAKFNHSNDLVKYQEVIADYGGQVLVGTSGSPATVACNTVVPITSTTALINYSNTSNVIAVMANPDCNYALSGSNWIFAMNAGSRLGGPMPLSTSQEFNYMMFSGLTSGNLLAIVIGYYYQR